MRPPSASALMVRPDREPRPRGRRTATRVAGLVAAATLVLPLAAGCSSGDEPGPAPTSATSAPADAPITVNTRALSGSFLPADAADPATERVVGLLFRGLVRYDQKGKAQMEVAESITSGDDQTFRVTLEPGWTFSDGTPVTSSSFVDAWNFAARPSSGMYRASAFAPIAGYDAMRKPTGQDTASKSASDSGSSAASSSASPTGLEGLDVLDDRTFTITLADPDPTFVERLGDPAFSPLPPSAIADPRAFAAAPVGNGPYTLSGVRASERATGGSASGSSTAAPITGGAVVSLRPDARYTGDDVPHNDGIDLVVYDDLDAAWTDFDAGRLDLLDGVAPDRLSQYRRSAGENSVDQPVGVADALVFPVRRAPWSGADGLTRRLAISRAVDRATHARETFAGTRSAATDLAAPVVEGSSQDLCGAACAHDASAAADLAEQAGGVGPLTIAYAADGDGKALVDAVCADVTQALQVTCTPKPYPNQIALRRALASGSETAPHLESWHMSRPALAAFLDPRFVPDAAANTSGYADDVVATRLRSAATASAAQQPQVYQDIEKTIVAALPVVPLWSAHATGAWSPTLGTVRTDAFGSPILTEVSRGG